MLKGVENITLKDEEHGCFVTNLNDEQQGRKIIAQLNTSGKGGYSIKPFLVKITTIDATTMSASSWKIVGNGFSLWKKMPDKKSSQ